LFIKIQGGLLGQKLYHKKYTKNIKTLKNHGLGRRGKFFMRLKRSIVKSLNRNKKNLRNWG
jgi:hypothetical protein